MDFPSNIFPFNTLAFSMLLFISALLLAVKSADWKKIRDPGNANVFVGSIVLVFIIWTMRAGIVPGANFHLLGVTTLVLMFGWAYGLLATTLVLLGITLYGHSGWESFGPNAVTMVLVPVLVTQMILYSAQRYLPHYFFIYVFLNAFLAAGLSSLAAGITGAGMLYFNEVYDSQWLENEYLLYMPLLFFPEAIVNGIVMTMFVAIKPEWVATFYDSTYLENK